MSYRGCFYLFSDPFGDFGVQFRRTPNYDGFILSGMLFSLGFFLHFAHGSFFNFSRFGNGGIPTGRLECLDRLRSRGLNFRLRLFNRCLSGSPGLFGGDIFCRFPCAFYLFCGNPPVNFPFAFGICLCPPGFFSGNIFCRGHRPFFGLFNDSRFRFNSRLFGFDSGSFNLDLFLFGGNVFGFNSCLFAPFFFKLRPFGGFPFTLDGQFCPEFLTENLIPFMILFPYIMVENVIHRTFDVT